MHGFFRYIFFTVVLPFLISSNINAQFVQQGNKLVGIDAIGSPQQGLSVAISADGNTAIVGGPKDNSYTGAVWVYTRSGGEWTQQGVKLIGTGAAGIALQGTAVSLSGDGNTAIVGGYADSNTYGAAWIFSRSGGVWTQQGNKLVGTGAVGAAWQGSSVCLSYDGNTAIVGGSWDSGYTGAVWIFTRSDSVWTQQGSKLVGKDAVGQSWQGCAVSLSGDGNTAIVGGDRDSSGFGAAWVFTRTGGVWTQQGNKLVGTGAVGAAWQAASVSLSADANTLIVGGSLDNGGIGACWVFTRTGDSWTQQGNKLVGIGGMLATQGNSVSISSDGNTVFIGGENDFNLNILGPIGAAWVFKRSSGVWAQLGNKLVGTDAVKHAAQGTSVALSADGRTAIVGGPQDSSSAGAAWVFIDTTAVTAVNENPFTQYNYHLSANYPNPFNPATNITYSIPKESYVSLIVYDLLGREVTRLVQEKKLRGGYQVSWNAAGVPSGVYYYRLVAGRFVETKKMILIK